jgi:hypothetical protein
MTRANPLPDDVETLKAMLLSQEAALCERDAQMLKLQETVDSQQAALASRAAEVEHLNCSLPSCAVCSSVASRRSLTVRSSNSNCALKSLWQTKVQRQSKSRRRRARLQNRHRASHCLSICPARSERTCQSLPGSARNAVAQIVSKRFVER